MPPALKADDSAPDSTPQFSPTPGTVAAQWHYPAGAPPSFRGGKRGNAAPVVLVYVITLPPAPDGAPAAAAPPVVVGEVCFDVTEVGLDTTFHAHIIL